MGRPSAVATVALSRPATGDTPVVKDVNKIAGVLDIVSGECL